MGTFATVLVVIGLLVCGFGVSWLYIDAYKKLFELSNLERAEAEYCPSSDEESEE